MDAAAAINAELPDEDPLATAFIAYRKVMDCTAAVTVGMLNSTNPVNTAMGNQGATALGVKTEGARLARERIRRGSRRRITAAAGTTARTYATAAKKAHPAFVNADGKLAPGPEHPDPCPRKKGLGVYLGSAPIYFVATCRGMSDDISPQRTAATLF